MNIKSDQMIGNSSVLANALEQLSRLATIDRPVLILGERGTGKELAADRLHFLSNRWAGPLMKVNCAAIAEQLLESELFGHEPGAFTGATRTHHGRFERAEGGTLFLDELATMSAGLQEKLLRLIEYGEFERLGGQQTLHVDVRVVAATNADLRKLAIEGKFRHDLLDRLSFDVVHLPPLRYRQQDTLELAHHFALKMCAELGWEVFSGFTQHATQTLMKHDWPGNVRELKNAVERSLFRWADPASLVDTIVIDPFISPFAAVNEQHHGVLKESPRQHVQVSSAPAQGFREQVEQLERELLLSALRASGNNKKRAAAALSLSYDQLRGLLRKYQLTRVGLMSS
jgi:psp operon transcriptional activator